MFFVPTQGRKWRPNLILPVKWPKRRLDEGDSPSAGVSGSTNRRSEAKGGHLSHGKRTSREKTGGRHTVVGININAPTSGDHPTGAPLLTRAIATNVVGDP